MLTKSRLWLLTSAIFLVSCSESDEAFKKRVAEVLKKDPKIITEAMEANPTEFMTTLQKMANVARKEMAKKKEEDRKQEFLKSFENPLEPKLRKDESFRGSKDAPITIVEYTDFQCPFCARGFQTISSLQKKYPGKIRVVYKHLPLSFHQQAMIAAQYYEAIRIQSKEKAFKFHDELFRQQEKIKKGEKFLDKIAKSVGANMKNLKKNLESKRVKERIAEDMAEAAKFGMQGTPGFIVNGIPVRGAYPANHFEMIFDELKKRGKLKI